MAGPFSSVVGLMEAWGAFNYLALLLVFIVLYFLFSHLLSKRERPRKKLHRDAISFVLALLLTALLYLLVLPFMGTAASYVVVVIFVVAVIFLILVLFGQMTGIDLPEMLKKDFG